MSQRGVQQKKVVEMVRWLNRQGWSDEDIAHCVGCSFMSIRNWRSGKPISKLFLDRLEKCRYGQGDADSSNEVLLAK